MSLAMGGKDDTTYLSTPDSGASLRLVSTEGLTSTIPAMASGCSCASRRVMVPPMDSPATTTDRQDSFRSASDEVAAANQSSNVVRLASCQLVPCPGNSGSSTL